MEKNEVATTIIASKQQAIIFLELKHCHVVAKFMPLFSFPYPIPFFYTFILTNHEEKVLKFVYMYTAGLQLQYSEVPSTMGSFVHSEGSFAFKDIFSGHFSCLYSNKKSERKLCQFDCIDISKRFVSKS